MNGSRNSPWPRAIIHLDLDSFYASVEQLKHPELQGKPVIVGGVRDSSGKMMVSRSVVSAASYEVRKYGVRSAMPLSKALQLCPHAHVLPVDFPAYRAMSKRVFALAYDITPLVEPLSLDEAFLDVTGSQLIFGHPAIIAQELRDKIYTATSLHASFGIAATKVIAKVASDREKPRGLVVVPPGQEAEFLAPLALRELPGLGPSTEKALLSLGIATLGQLSKYPLPILQRRLGTTHGISLQRRAVGIDSSEVTLPDQPKSISRETTFEHDTTDRTWLNDHIHKLSALVAKQLRSDELHGKTITLKVRFADFSTITRQHTLSSPTDADQSITHMAIALLNQAWSGAAIRLIGVGITNLDGASQLDLLDTEDNKSSVLDHTLDELQKRFGTNAVRRGTKQLTLHDRDFRGEDLRNLNGKVTKTKN